MAGAGKEYTMTFLLKAATDSSYQAALSKAKQELNSYQKDIQAMNSTLRDISAYQRQEQAVQKVADKLELQKKALKDAADAASAAGGNNSKLNQAQAQAEVRVKNTTERLKQQEQKLREMGSGLQQAGVDTGNLTSEQQRLGSAIEETKKQQEALAQQQNEWLSSIAEMEAMASTAYMIAQGVEKIGEAWAACVSSAGEFQHSLSAVEAVSGATKEEMGELGAMAKDIGANTIFTATEIADALEYMGLAGWSASEMMEGMPAVANLTAAAGEDLSRVCDIVTDSMQALGYSTADTGRFCDVLAKTVTSANTTVDLMGDTLKYVSSTAGALGYSIEDVSTAIAAMANMGIKGSMNGTALRNVLINLAAPSEAAAKAIEELGVAIADENGNAYELNDTISQLRQAFSGLSQEEKAQYANTIAGKRGLQGLLALVNTSQEEYDALAATIKDCNGAAEEMAEIRLDNFQGRVTILKSAWDALKTSIGEIYLGGLADGADALTDITNAANGFVKEYPQVVVGATAAAGAFGAMALGVTGVSAAMKLMNSVFKGTALANPSAWGIMAAVAGVVGLGTAIYTVAKNTETAGEKMARLNEEISELEGNQALIDEYQELRKEIEAGEQSTEDLEAAKQRLYEIEQQLADAYPEQLEGIEAETDAYDAQLEVLERLSEAEKNQKSAEIIASAKGSAIELAGAQERLKEAQEDAATAWENMQAALNATDMSYVKDEIQGAIDTLQQDIEAGTIEVDTDAYREKLKEIGGMATAVSGQNMVFSDISGAENFLENFDSNVLDSAELAGYWGEQYQEASERVAAEQATVDDLSGGFRFLLENGVATADEIFKSYGVTLADMGLTTKAVGEMVVNGAMTAAEANQKYGMSYTDINRGIAAYKKSIEETGDPEQDQAERQAQGKKQLAQYSLALKAVKNETLDASQAAQMYGMDVDALNEFLEAEEQWEKNVAGAVAAVDAGYLDAETAAERFGVSIAEMDVYRAEQNMEALDQQLQELQEAYDNAKKAAKDSIMGQVSATEALGTSEQKVASLSKATANLQKSAEYIQKYQAALATLNDFGLDPSVVSTFCDSSAEGMAQAIYWANELNNTDASNANNMVSELNEAFSGVETATEGASGALAEAQTESQKTKDEIVQKMMEAEQGVSDSMDEIVADMSRSKDAGAAGTATGAAYANALKIQLDQAISNAYSAAAEVQAALEGKSSGTIGRSGSKKGGGKAHGGFTHGPELAGEDPRYPVEAVISFNPAYHDQNVEYLKQAADMLGVPQEIGQVTVASGDDGSGEYAAVGLTEYGAAMVSAVRQKRQAETVTAPVYMGGGESAGGMTLKVTIYHNTQVDSSTGESIQEQLAKYDDDLIGKIQRVVLDMQAEAGRKKF